MSQNALYDATGGGSFGYEAFPCYALPAPDEHPRTPLVDYEHQDVAGEISRARASRECWIVHGRAITAMILFLVGLFGAGIVGYRAGAMDYRHMQGSDTVADNPPGIPTISTKKPQPREERVCAHFAAAYRMLPKELRSTRTDRPGTEIIPTPSSKLAGAATDLAEVLRHEVHSAYSQSGQWPAWQETMNRYVGALNAFSFVVANSTAPEPVWGDIGELYQRSLPPVLALCHVTP